MVIFTRRNGNAFKGGGVIPTGETNEEKVGFYASKRGGEMASLPHAHHSHSLLGRCHHHNLFHSRYNRTLSFTIPYRGGGGALRGTFCDRLRVTEVEKHEIVCVGAMASKRGDVKVFEGVQDLATGLADYIAELSDATVKERGAFSVALSGGSLISTMSKLCEPPYLKTIDWSKWHIFWADERVVPRTHPDSNYKLAKDGLLSRVPIIPGQVYSINDALTVDAAAEDYEFGLRQLVKTRIVHVSSSSDCPRFDLILLGMGPDGHVASLFPGHPLTHEKDKWIASIKDSPKPPPERITFTFPVLNSAANVAMVLTGANKADVLEKAFGELQPPGVLPVQMVVPTEGNLVWFLDKPAASKL